MSTPLPRRHCFVTSDADPGRPSIHFSASGVDLLRRNKSGVCFSGLVSRDDPSIIP